MVLSSWGILEIAKVAEIVLIFPWSCFELKGRGREGSEISKSVLFWLLLLRCLLNLNFWIRSLRLCLLKIPEITKPIILLHFLYNRLSLVVKNICNLKHGLQEYWLWLSLTHKIWHLIQDPRFLLKRCSLLG